MADFYKKGINGNDSNDGTTWALAKLTDEGLKAVMSAGDTGWSQEDDAVAGSRTLTSPGTKQNPCIFKGVAVGTTNEPPLLADLAVTLPIIDGTTGGNDMAFEGVATYVNMHLKTRDKLTATSFSELTIINGQLTLQDDVLTATAQIILINSVLETTATSASFLLADFRMFGGSILSTTAATLTDLSQATGGTRVIDLTGVDISDRGTTAIVGASTSTDEITLRNCKTPSVFNLFTSAPTGLATCEAIGCSDTTSVTGTDSIQDYIYQDAHGTIDLELTAVRTGGADDDASGLFAYALTPAASAVLESSGASLKSPWMRVWVEAGNTTLTIKIANDGAGDLNEDQVYIEAYTADAGDTAQFDQSFDPGDARLFASSTAVTDDTGSTWGGSAANHQELSVTNTHGYEGEAYVRLHYLQRSATPDTLFLDPEPVVS